MDDEGYITYDVDSYKCVGIHKIIFGVEIEDHPEWPKISSSFELRVELSDEQDSLPYYTNVQ